MNWQKRIFNDSIGSGFLEGNGTDAVAWGFDFWACWYRALLYYIYQIWHNNPLKGSTINNFSERHIRCQETFTKTSSFCSLALGQQTLRCILQDLRGLVAGYMAVLQHGYLGNCPISCSWQPLIKTQSGIIQVPKCVKRPWGNNTLWQENQPATSMSHHQAPGGLQLCHLHWWLNDTPPAWSLAWSLWREMNGNDEFRV